MKAKFILIDAVDVQDFILRLIFMKKYNILMALMRWMLMIRYPYV